MLNPCVCAAPRWLDKQRGGCVCAAKRPTSPPLRHNNAHTLQLSRMHRQVDDLQTALLSALRDRGQPTVIVHGGGRASG